jgi:Tol biopolymer transport system component
VVETAVDDRRRYYRVPFGENGPRPAEAVLLDEALGVADFRAWSPDEDWLFFRAHARDGNAEIYRMNLWDGRLHNLTQHPEADRFVDFSPDGEWVIIESQRAGPPEIYRLPVEGGPFENLTHSGAVTRFLMWWPGVTMDWSGDGLLLLGLAMGAGGVGLSAFRYRR